METTYYYVGAIEDLKDYGFDVHEYDVYIILTREDLHGGNIVINLPLLDIEKEEADVEFDLGTKLTDLIEDNKVIVIGSV